MKTRIHVNQHKIRANRVLPKRKAEPVITVKDYKQNRYGFTADIIDENTGDVVASVVYRPEKPLSCGAVLWVETDNPVVVDGEELPK